MLGFAENNSVKLMIFRFVEQRNLNKIFVYIQGWSLLTLYHSKPTNYQSNIFVPTDGVEFPHITICKFNPVKKSAVEKLKKHLGLNTTQAQSVIDYLMMSYMSVENLYTFDSVTREAIREMDHDFQQFNYKYKQKNTEGYKIQDFFNQTGYCRCHCSITVMLRV